MSRDPTLRVSNSSVMHALGLSYHVLMLSGPAQTGQSSGLSLTCQGEAAVAQVHKLKWKWN